MAEGGPIPEQYGLKETPSAAPLQCNEWNVWDADGVAIISMDGRLSAYCIDTLRLADKHRKPSLHIQAEGHSAVKDLRGFVKSNQIGELNLNCCQETEGGGTGPLISLVLTDAFCRSLPDRSEKCRQSTGVSVAKPGVETATDGLVPDRVDLADDDAPFSDSHFLALYRSFEGREEYGARIRPMVVNPAIPPGTDEFHLASGMASLTQSKPGEAAHELEQISEGMRGHPNIVQLLLYAYLGAGNWPRLVEASQDFSRLQPEKHFGWAFWAVALDKMGQTKEGWPATIKSDR